MDFKQAVNIVIKMEGGYVNDPKDPGGETKYGISKRSYPEVDITNLTKGHAKDIYKRDYWNKCMCDGLAKPLRLLVFDCAVNQGAVFAIKTLQGLCHVSTDGIMGPKTLEALEEMNEDRLIELFILKRFDRYHSNRNYRIYGKGWINRLLTVSVYSLRL